MPQHQRAVLHRASGALVGTVLRLRAAGPPPLLLSSPPPPGRRGLAQSTSFALSTKASR